MSKATIVQVTHAYPHPPERVFDAWLDPKMIGRFMFGSHLRDEEVVHLKNEARAGGTFSFLVQRQGQSIDHIGRYEVIERPRKLVFTWSVVPQPIDASRVSILIEPRGAGCVLTLSHELAPGWEDYAERTKGGWSCMTDELMKALPQDYRSTRDVILRTPDWERAKAFYGATLGFGTAYEDDRMIGFETGTFRLYVEKGAAHGPVFELIVDDVQAVKRKLLAEGCSVVEEDARAPRCYVRDPYGFTFNLGQR